MLIFILLLPTLFVVAYLVVNKMENIHYIEFKATDKHAPIGHCVSDLMSQLHGYMRRHKVILGVSFPAMTDVFIGDTVRVFGTNKQLTDLLANEGIKNGCSRHVYLLSVYCPTEIPTTAIPVIYLKDVNIYPNSDIAQTAFKRALKRYNQRHSELMPKSDERLFRLSFSNKVKDAPYLMIKSQDDNGHRKTFRFSITKREGLQGNTFNTFGLGNSGGYVYDF